ncbi:DUF2267 domain-containing protein [Streptomyces sp. A7024]|uniref:DUF2267 domain-containing protein n=1 Tax=Streptomyces coryli TaxID=1128680 RepID=A0A6G4U9R1_9ACTN|nr:DUF2267 domain-containing protein [Streptomyces coryli]NGN68863.1 DUF2267 domain-containing protein [Streptomyces coryli]
MQRNELIGQVRAVARLADREAAERAVRGTLETLAERIPAATAAHLAAQLPPDIGAHLTRTAHSAEPTAAERFDLAAFAGRVAWRTSCDEEDAVLRAGAVFEVLDAAVDPDLMEKLVRVLPADIRELLPASRA